MKPQIRKMILRHLTEELSHFTEAQASQPPKGGWLRSIRLALGMPARYPARKLGLTTQGYHKLEKNEDAGTITLNALKKSAEAINCKLVYALVPASDSLEAVIQEQANKQARRAMGRVARTMLLESQTSGAAEQRINELAKELADAPKATLWREE